MSVVLKTKKIRNIIFFILTFHSYNIFLYVLQPSVRKTHCSGRKHKENVRLYYQKWLEEQVQKLVDDTSEYTRTYLKYSDYEVYENNLFTG
jgi:hypothetical protein